MNVLKVEVFVVPKISCHIVSWGGKNAEARINEF